jgi:hypothetical protein
MVDRGSPSRVNRSGARNLAMREQLATVLALLTRGSAVGLIAREM